MNSQRIYYEIIQNAKLRGLNKKSIGGYFEKHHIIPRSLNGSNCKTNLVLLTAREHFICHYLLTKIYKENTQHYKMIKAFFMMTWNSKEKKQQRYVNSRLYNSLKNAYAKAFSNQSKGENNSQFGTVYYYNRHTFENKRFKPDEIVGDDWIKGRYGVCKINDKIRKIKYEDIKNERFEYAKKTLEHYLSIKCKSFKEYCKLGHYDKSYNSLRNLFKLLPEYDMLCKPREGFY